MYIKVEVQADSKKEELLALSADNFKLKVRAKAERNMANDRVREMLASYFKLPAGKIRIVSGHHHPHKIVNVDV